jgi:hypothetical protein
VTKVTKVRRTQGFKVFPAAVKIASSSFTSISSSSVLLFSIQPNSLIISNQYAVSLD